MRSLWAAVTAVSEATVAAHSWRGASLRAKEGQRRDRYNSSSPTLHRYINTQKKLLPGEPGESHVRGRQSRSPSMDTPKTAAVVPSSQTSLGFSSGTGGIYS